MLSPLTDATPFLTASTVANAVLAPKPVEVTGTMSSCAAYRFDRRKRSHMAAAVRLMRRNFFSISWEAALRGLSFNLVIVSIAKWAYSITHSFNGTFKEIFRKFVREFRVNLN